MFDNLIQYYYNYFMDERNNKWALLSSSVCVMVMNELYQKFIKEDIEPIEKLPIEKKQYYFNAIKNYSTDKHQLIKLGNAAYVLELITSTF